MKNKYPGHCFRCEKYVPKEQGRIHKEGTLKLLCLSCYKGGGLEEMDKILAKVRAAYYKNYLAATYGG